EALAEGPVGPAAALLAELLALAGDLSPEPVERNLPFLPIHIAKDGAELHLFTTIATLGTPRDVTVHELRLESFFPGDDATAQWFAQRNGTAGPR
ncbi:MAG TPA: hypothetical protein VIT92_08500, partial [Burkholderiaceae bacterium]